MTVTDHVIGRRNYELSNHLGNVLSTISDKPVPHDNSGDVDYWLADIRTSQDYSPFGVTLEGRNFVLIGADKSRYGFQSQEADDEIKGAGNSYNYTYRMHDPRLGRFFAVDPLMTSYPELTPYQFSNNSPIFMIELEGLEGIIHSVTQYYAADGLHKSETERYTVEGLKADLIKICWKKFNDPMGPVTHINYYGRTGEGKRSGHSIQNIKPNQKPSIKEFNTFFGGDQNNSYTIRKSKQEWSAIEQSKQHWYTGSFLSPNTADFHYAPFEAVEISLNAPSLSYKGIKKEGGFKLTENGDDGGIELWVFEDTYLTSEYETVPSYSMPSITADFYLETGDPQKPDLSVNAEGEYGYFKAGVSSSTNGEKKISLGLTVPTPGAKTKGSFSINYKIRGSESRIKL